MIHRIIEFSLRQPVLVLLATLLLIGVGIWSATRLPIDAVPDITNVQVQFNTSVPALAPEEIEKLVTVPLENEMAGLPNMMELRSLSKFGLSQVTIVFKDGTDVYRTRQLASERLQAALEHLPPGLQPRLAPISTGLGEIYHYIVSYRPGATNKPATPYEALMALKSTHDYFIKPLLRATPGVAEVNSIGGYEKQIVIMPDPQKLANAGMTLHELAGKVAENVENAGGGLMEVGGEQIVVRAASRVQTPEEILNLPLKFRAGVEAMTVRDVAEVGIGSSFRTGAATDDGEEAVVGSAIMLMGENSRMVARAVNARIKDIQEKLPPGIQIHTGYDRSDLVNRTIHTVEKNLFEGALLVVIVLLALLGNWRAALIVALAIPLSMLFAMTGMVEGRISGNLMSLGAIDFGLIIDGAVVMVENIIRHLAHRQHQLQRTLTNQERVHEVLVAAKEVANPMFYGVLIITVVYIPILALTGIEGKMFKPMALTVIFALLGALVLALTLMPVLCSFFLSGKIKEEDNFLMRLFKALYRPTLRFALSFRWMLVGLAVALLLITGVVFSRLGAEFVPQLNEGSLVIQMMRSASLGLNTSLDLQLKSEQVLRDKFPEISHIFSRVGTAEIANDPMPPNLSDTFVSLQPRNTWRKISGHTATEDQLIGLMQRELTINVPGQAFLFTQPIQMRFNEIMAGARADISAKVYGEDYAKLEQLATQLRDVLRSVATGSDVEFEAIGQSPILEITPDRSAMKRFNVQAGEVNHTISAALAGEEVGTMVEGNQRFEIVVRLPERLRENMDVIKRLPVRTEDGGMITLAQVAKVDMTQRVGTINHEANHRRLAILINLRGRDVESFVREATARIKEQVKFPEGYYYEFGGQFKNLQEARARLAVVVPFALLLIFVFIFFAFGSVRQVLVVYTGIPLAITGGVFALAIRGMPFSISAGVGFIALSGVAVLNGLVMISYYNLLRERGGTIRQVVEEGSLTRLRPVLMTAFVASLGFLPMALATGSGAEVQRPLATVVIGGIISSTFLTLVLLPALYEWSEKKAEAKKRKSRLGPG
ncbi:MAG: cation transporter [Pedosphaera sp.]|nr:cation transporter [Pedosphaera sp.]